MPVRGLPPLSKDYIRFLLVILDRLNLLHLENQPCRAPALYVTKSSFRIEPSRRLIETGEADA